MILAPIVLAQALLDLHPQSYQDAVKQQSQVLDETNPRTDYWIERHQRDETNQQLQDLNDSITIQGIINGDE